LPIQFLGTFSGRIFLLFSESLGLRSPNAKVPEWVYVSLEIVEYFTVRIPHRIRIKEQ